MNDTKLALSHFLLAIKETHSTFLGLLRNHFFEFFAIFLGCELFDQFFKYVGAQSAAYGQANIGVPLGRLNVALLLFVLLTMLIPLRDMQDRGEHEPMGLWGFTLKHLKPFTLENLRYLGWVLLFLPLLIIPGLYKYCQLIMVPYVVLCDREYQEGHVDALSEASRLMKGFAFIGVIVMLVSLPVVYKMAVITEPILLTQEPLKWLLLFPLSSLLYFYFNLLLYMFYRVRKKVLPKGG